jgi:large subunit ribosomal protein L9
MKVILLQDVTKVGRRHEVRQVSDGYAMNFLLPNGLAELATESKVAALSKQEVQRTERKAVQRELLEKDLEKSSGKKIAINSKANEKGHLFKGIHAADIVAAIETQLGIRLPEDALKLSEPIKETGDHTVAIAAKDGKTIAVLVSVEKRNA